MDFGADRVSGGIYTTTVEILGGSYTVVEWGDPAVGSTVVGDPIPMSITEGRINVATESDPGVVTTHYYTGRAPAGTQVTAAQRLRDTVSGIIYLIDYVNTPNAVGTPGDVRLDLRRVT